MREEPLPRHVPLGRADPSSSLHASTGHRGSVVITSGRPSASAPMRPDHTHPANAIVLEQLRRLALPARPSDEPFVLDGYTLRTHPDLAERLFELAAALPADCHASAFGVPVLVAPSGILFAVAGGTFDVALRVAPHDEEAARAFGAQPDTSYGPGWWRFAAFSPSLAGRESFTTDLQRWCARAFAHASG